MFCDVSTSTSWRAFDKLKEKLHGELAYSSSSTRTCYGYYKSWTTYFLKKKY
jgi:hypothetical protein